MQLFISIHINIYFYLRQRQDTPLSQVIYVYVIYM